MQKTPPAAGSPPPSSPQTLQAQDKFFSSKKETTIQGQTCPEDHTTTSDRQAPASVIWWAPDS